MRRKSAAHFLSAAVATLALGAAAPSHAHWGDFGTPPINKGGFGTCFHSHSGNTTVRTAEVWIQEAWLVIDDFPPFFLGDQIGLRNSSPGTPRANLGAFFIDNNLAGPWNFFYEEFLNVARGARRFSNRLGALALAQCRVGNV